MAVLYASVTNTTGLINITVSTSHSSQSAVAVVEALNTTLDIGDAAEIYLGYVGNNARVFNGFLKNITYQEPERKYVLTFSDILVRAMEYFMASTNPDEPFSRSNITAEALVEDLLLEAGLDDYNYDETSFTFAIKNPLEINLTSVYDYCRFIGDLISWHLYAGEDGYVNFVNRKPYVMDGTSGQVHDTPDVPIGEIDVREVLSASRSINDKNLRNRVVVYGAEGIYAEAKEESPYLPVGFYRSAVVASALIFDTQEMADRAAEYNLNLYNRLTESVSMTTVGNPLYLARKCITFNRANIGVSGNWYIFSAEHTWNKAGYITTMELRK